MGIIKSLIEAFQLNETFFVYMAVFFVFLFLVSRLLLTPYFYAFLKRDEKTQGRLILSSQLQEENQSLIKEYKQKLVHFNQRFQEKLKEKKEELNKKNILELDRIKKTTHKWIQEQRVVFQNDFNKAKEEVKKEAPSLAEQLNLKLF